MACFRTEHDSIRGSRLDVTFADPDTVFMVIGTTRTVTHYGGIMRSDAGDTYLVVDCLDGRGRCVVYRDEAQAQTSLL